MKSIKESVSFNSDVAEAVKDGLSRADKFLPSWLLYDKKGDQLFQQIMRLPEYYLSRCETQILHDKKDRIAKLFSLGGRSFRMLELGAGDGVKTEILLRYFRELDIPFIYSPVDISKDSLDRLTSRLEGEMPDIRFEPHNKLYSDALKNLITSRDRRKAILFLGANIGNFSAEDAEKFVRGLVSNMYLDDWLLIGFDLKKDPNLIQSAYGDKKGITRAFNFNLLERLNREVGARFDVAQFEYYSSYDPETGAVKSYLVSQRDQDVHIEALDTSVHFDKWEAIRTEISQKYNLVTIEEMADQVGLKIEDVFYDEEKYFCDVVMRL